MFSRFRMSPIVEIQGSDWDWLRLIAASGTGAAHAVEGREREKNTQNSKCGSWRCLTGVQLRTVDGSHHRIQLPAWRTNTNSDETEGKRYYY